MDRPVVEEATAQGDPCHYGPEASTWEVVRPSPWGASRRVTCTAHVGLACEDLDDRMDLHVRRLRS